MRQSGGVVAYDLASLWRPLRPDRADERAERSVPRSLLGDVEAHLSGGFEQRFLEGRPISQLGEPSEKPVELLCPGTALI